MPTIVTEALGASSVDSEGTLLIRLITAGSGSSGDYPAETLEAAGARRVFPAGTLMYADHPGEAERIDRPERSIRDIAAVLTEDAYYVPDAQALDAKARPFGIWKEALPEMKDAIGVSIRAKATLAKESAPSGRPIVESLDEAISVDFVTRAGREGSIREVYEAAQDRARSEGREVVVMESVRESRVSPPAPPSVPVTPAGQSNTPESEEDTMSEQTTEVSEASRRAIEALETERDAALSERDVAVREALEARREVDAERAARIIAESGHPFTALEQRGLLASLPIVEESGRLDAEAFEKIVAEEAEKSAPPAGTGRVFGLGAFRTGDAEISEADFDAELARITGRVVKEA